MKHSEPDKKQVVIDRKAKIVSRASRYYADYIHTQGMARSLVERLRENPHVIEYINSNEPWVLASNHIQYDVGDTFKESHNTTYYEQYLIPELKNLLSDIYDEGARYAYIEGYTDAETHYANKIKELEEEIAKLRDE